MTREMQAYVENHGGLWKTLVAIGYHIGSEHIDREAELLAHATQTTKATVKRKFEAIRHMREIGLSEEAVVRAGQGPTLSKYYIASKKKKAEADTVLRYRVPVSLGEAWGSLVARLARVADLRTSEDLIEFLHSVFVGLNDDQIKNLAGELDPNRKARRV
jgi:hypothetical protein